MVNTCLKDINKLQQEIMLFVDIWVREEKTPVPLQEIKAFMVEKGSKDFTVISAIKVLLRKGYIRRAIGIRSNKTSYVQLRRV